MCKQLFVFVALLVSCCFISCKRQSVLDEKTNYIADLECRAVLLREQRFALANQLRFAQDTLLTAKSSSDSLRLSSQIHIFTKEKEILLQHSLQLADTIHLQLDSLRKFIFTGSNDKKLFDQKLNEVLQKRGCAQQ